MVHVLKHFFGLFSANLQTNVHDYREQVRKLNVQLVIDQDEMDALRERIHATTTDLDRLVIAKYL